jgi:hypothetical protein
MVQSALEMSAADVLIYVDQDDPELAGYQRFSWLSRVKLTVGPPVTRGPAVNALCDAHRDYRAYLIVSDDIVFDRDDWEEQVWDVLDRFGDDIGCVHLQSEDREDYVNWAIVSRRWIDALGWFNFPGCLYFCQDTIIQSLATALGKLEMITPPVLTHQAVAYPEAQKRLEADTRAFLIYMAKQFGNDLKRLREAQGG